MIGVGSRVGTLNDPGVGSGHVAKGGGGGAGSPDRGSGSARHPVLDPYADERDAWTVLASVDRVGPIGFAALLAHFGTGRSVRVAASEPGGVARLAETPPLGPGPHGRYRSPVSPPTAAAIADAAATGDRTLERVRGLGLRVVTVEEPAYPARLAAIDLPPHLLFVRGSIAALGSDRAVAIVGTRRATSVGRTIAARIAVALSGAGAAVVSGLAYGIDGASHEATLRAGGTTVAVIGGGHAVGAPGGHKRLADAIAGAGGAVISEHPPDVEPTQGTFPRRNRIISGLSEATVVVEAPARSGALITASWALEQGRECFIVPGPLGAPASAGCLAFLREFHDARVVAGIPQLIADLGLAGEDGDLDTDAVAAATLSSVGETEGRIGRQLLLGRVTVDEIVAALDLPVATVLAALTMLERRGLAVGVNGRFRPAGTLLGAPPLPPAR